MAMISHHAQLHRAAERVKHPGGTTAGHCFPDRKTRAAPYRRRRPAGGSCLARLWSPARNRTDRALSPPISVIGSGSGCAPWGSRLTNSGDQCYGRTTFERFLVNQTIPTSDLSVGGFESANEILWMCQGSGTLGGFFLVRQQRVVAGFGVFMAWFPSCLQPPFSFKRSSLTSLAERESLLE